MSRLLLVVVLVTLITSCSKQAQSPTLKIAINPWPGYEFLYLAKELGYYQEAGLNVDLLEVASLADAKRLYSIGKANGMTSTLVEVVRSAVEANKQTSVVLVADYSNGGDVILADNSIAEISDLTGKTVGAELSSLGVFFLHQALASKGLTLDAVTLTNVEQLDAPNVIAEGKIDAYVTYPPYSLEILRNGKFHTIFDSSLIPQTIVDVLSIESELLKQDPTITTKLRQVWRKTLEYARANPNVSNQIMAAREGISIAEFNDTLAGLRLVEASEQANVIGSQLMQDNVLNVCEVLNKTNVINYQCSNIDQVVKLAK